MAPVYTDVSSLLPTGHMYRKAAINVAQHKTLNIKHCEMLFPPSNSVVFLEHGLQMTVLWSHLLGSAFSDTGEMGGGRLLCHSECQACSVPVPASDWTPKVVVSLLLLVGGDSPDFRWISSPKWKLGLLHCYHVG